MSMRDYEDLKEDYFEDENDLDEDDFWNDTPEFDEQIEEFKTALRADVKRETKELIERLQKELDELKYYKAHKNEIEAGYSDEVAKLKKAELELEDKYRNKKAQAIFVKELAVRLQKDIESNQDKPSVYNGMANHTQL